MGEDNELPPDDIKGGKQKPPELTVLQGGQDPSGKPVLGEADGGESDLDVMRGVEAARRLDSMGSHIMGRVYPGEAVADRLEDLIELYGAYGHGDVNMFRFERGIFIVVAYLNSDQTDPVRFVQDALIGHSGGDTKKDDFEYERALDYSSTKLVSELLQLFEQHRTSPNIQQDEILKAIGPSAAWNQASIKGAAMRALTQAHYSLLAKFKVGKEVYPGESIDRILNAIRQQAFGQSIKDEEMQSVETEALSRWIKEHPHSPPPNDPGPNLRQAP